MRESGVRAIVGEYRDGLRAILGERLRSVVLFGSQARGEARAGLDIDVLCVLNGPFDYGELIERTSELTATISLKYDAALSRVFTTENDCRNRTLPFFMNVRKEGIAI